MSICPSLIALSMSSFLLLSVSLGFSLCGRMWLHTHAWFCVCSVCLLVHGVAVECVCMCGVCVALYVAICVCAYLVYLAVCCM